MKFNLEKALKDGKAMTRDGQEVTQLVRFDSVNDYPIEKLLAKARGEK